VQQGLEPAGFQCCFTFSYWWYSCTTSPQIISAADCECVEPDQPRLLISSTNNADAYDLSYSANGPTITTTTAYCDHYENSIPWRLLGFNSSATVEASISDGPSGITTQLPFIYNESEGYWNIGIPSLICRSSIVIDIEVTQCNQSYEWTVADACPTLRAEILVQDTTDSCDLLGTSVSGVGGPIEESNYAWTITTPSGTYMASGSVLSPSAFLSPGQTGTFDLVYTDPTCNYSASDSVVYQLCSYSGVNVDIVEINPGRVCDTSAVFEYYYTAECSATSSLIAKLNGVNRSTLYIGANGCRAGGGQQITFSPTQIQSGVNTLEIFDGPTLISSIDFIPLECGTSAPFFTGSVQPSRCNGGQCIVSGTAILNRKVGCDAFSTIGGEDCEIYIDSVPTGQIINASLLQWDAGNINNPCITVPITPPITINKAGLCAPSAVQIIVQLVGVDTLNIYSSNSLQINVYNLK
jgi:hypothetical protein